MSSINVEKRILSTYLFLIFGLGLNYIYSILLAKILGASEFGIYIYCISVFNIAAIIANSDLDKASIKYIPTKLNVDQFKTAIHLFGLLSSLFFAFLFITVTYALFTGSTKNNLLIYSIAIPLYVIISINLSFLQAEHIISKRLAIKYFIEPTTKMAIFIIIIFVYNNNNHQPQAIHAAISLVAALAITNIFCIALFHKKTLSYRKYACKNTLKKVLTFSSTLSTSNIVGVIAGKMDILIIGMILLTIDTGVYGAALQTSAMLAIILQGLEMVFAPTYSENLAQGDLKSLSSNFKKSLRLSLLLALPLFTFFICFPEKTMGLFGDEYKEGATALAILSFSQLCNLSTGSANLLLIILGKTKIVLFSNLFYLVISTVCILAGAKISGITGAAIGVLASTLALNAIRTFSVYTITNIHPYSRHSISILVIMAFIYIVHLLFHTIIGPSGIIIYPIISYILIYLMATHPDDIHLMNRLTNKKIEL